MSPFEGSPWSVYVPPRCVLVAWSPKATANSPSARRPAKGGMPARLIPPEEVGQETRGKGTNTRHVRNILPDTSPMRRACSWSR